MVYVSESQQKSAYKVHFKDSVMSQGQFWPILNCGTWKMIPSDLKWVYRLFLIPGRCETLTLPGKTCFPKNCVKQ